MIFRLDDMNRTCSLFSHAISHANRNAKLDLPLFRGPTIITEFFVFDEPIFLIVDESELPVQPS